MRNPRSSMIPGLDGGVRKTDVAAVKNMDGLPLAALGNGGVSSTFGAGSRTGSHGIQNVFEMLVAVVTGTSEFQKARIAAKVERDKLKKSGDELILRNAEIVEQQVDEEVEQDRKRGKYHTQSVENELIDLAVQRATNRLTLCRSQKVDPSYRAMYEKEIRASLRAEIKAIKSRGEGAVKRRAANRPAADVKKPVAVRQNDRPAEKEPPRETVLEVMKKWAPKLKDGNSKPDDWYDGK